MPNWTNITIKMNGIGNEDLYDELGDFDFNKIIPEPKTAEECIEKYGEQCIDHDNHHLMHSDGDKWFNWYDWHCRYWGTKWNACSTYKEDDYVTFRTAWSEPAPILRELARRYPDRGMVILYEYEEGYVGKYEVNEGEIEKVFEGEKQWIERDDGDYDEFVSVTIDGVERNISVEKWENMIA